MNENANNSDMFQNAMIAAGGAALGIVGGASAMKYSTKYGKKAASSIKKGASTVKKGKAPKTKRKVVYNANNPNKSKVKDAVAGAVSGSNFVKNVYNDTMSGFKQQPYNLSKDSASLFDQTTDKIADAVNGAVTSFKKGIPVKDDLKGKVKVHQPKDK